MKIVRSDVDLASFEDGRSLERSAELVLTSTQQSAREKGRELGAAAVDGMFSLCGACILPPLFLVSLFMAIRKRTRGWKVTAALTGLLSLNMLVVAIFLEMRPESEQLKPGTALVTSTDGAVQLTVPSRWHEIGGLEAHVSISIGDASRSEHLMLLANPELAPEGFLGAQADAFAEGMLAEFRDGRIDSRELVNISGYPAVRVVMVGEIQETSVVLLQLCVDVGETIHIFRCSTTPERREAALPLYDEVLASIKSLHD